MTTTERERIAQIVGEALLALRYCVATISDAPACACGRYVWDAAARCWLCHTEGGGYPESDEQTCMKCRCNMSRDGRVWQPGVMQLPELEDQESDAHPLPNFADGLTRALVDGARLQLEMYRKPRCLGDILDSMDVAGAEVAPHEDTSIAGVG